MIRRIAVAATVIVFVISGRAWGTEPNETFATATVLSPGTFSVSDQLTAGGGGGPIPDTFLGVVDLFGEVYFTDDDGSPVGDGHASGLGGVPTNSGSIDFKVTGYPDEFFEGSHGESGEYEVFVDVYDFFDDLVDQFSETRTLGPGEVHSFSFFDANWISGSYDVYIDNLVGGTTAWDVDYFRFTGLTPGTEFTARTTDPGGSGVDTVLGWFSAGGALLDSDDQSGGGDLSLLTGTVPAGGALTFAVTGYDDFGFVGEHGEEGSYSLVLELDSGVIAGDYNDDGIVDAVDYTVWRNNLGDATEADINNAGNGTGGVTAADYTWWKQRYGNTSGAGGIASVQVPEPSGVILCLLGCLLGTVSKRSAAGR
jgi:hypothetical protein